jgi:asparagine synthetase B (glutamine-hydrolysing)
MVAINWMSQIKYNGLIKLQLGSIGYNPSETDHNEPSSSFSVSGFYLSNKQLVKYENEDYIFILDGLIYELNKQPFHDGQLIQLIDHLSVNPEQALRLINGEFVLFLIHRALPLVIIATSFSGNAALFYRKFSDSIVFSNSMTEISKSGINPPAIRQQRIYDILKANNLGSAETCFSGVERLLPGMIMKIESGQISISAYTDLFQNFVRVPILKEPYIEFRNIFHHALKIRMKGEQIGIALSSGKDSTAVAVMAESILTNNQRISSYTFYPSFLPGDRISDYRFNENILLKSLLDRYPKINNQKVEVPLGSLLSSLERSLEIYGEPVYGVSNQFWIQKMHGMMHQDACEIMLTGQGGNYTISWPPPELVSAKQRRKYAHLKRFIRPEKQISDLPYLNRDFLEGVNNEHFLSRDLPPDIHLLQPILLKNSLAYSGYLQKQVSLYHGFQITDPTMDQHLVEYCLKMPFDVYHDKWNSRKLATLGLKEMLPREIRENTIRGIQASDLQYRLMQERGSFIEKLEFLNNNKLATFVIETDKLLKDWYSMDFSKLKRKELNHLLRLMLVGMFLSNYKEII